MTSVVHELDAHEGGSFRISLTYEASTRARKTIAHTDTYHGHFAKLVPNEQGRLASLAINRSWLGYDVAHVA